MPGVEPTTTDDARPFTDAFTGSEPGTIGALLATLDTSTAKAQGDGFEQVVAWMLTNAEPWRSKVDQVWSWEQWRDEHPGCYGPDDGIDLVARDDAGALWAVQAKAYTPGRRIKKADIDSFLSASARPEFTHRLLVATTDEVGHRATTTMEAQQVPVSRVLLSDLEAVEVPWPSALADVEANQPPVREAPRPRPHQVAAVDTIAERFSCGVDRGQLVMACGTGKTLTSAFLAERLAAERVLVLVPSLSLLRQTLAAWCSVLDIDWLAVCSDATVADGMTAGELGFPVTTSSEDVTEFLRRERGVVFCTYQSAGRVAEAMVDPGVAEFDLVVADEAHHCAGAAGEQYTAVLDATKVRAARRLFMTATPRTYTSRVQKAAKAADLDVVSMDDVEKFGPVLHTLSFADAIDEGLLSDYQVVVVGVDDETYRKWAHNGRKVTAEGLGSTDARTLARTLGLAKAMRDHDLRRVITFHSRVAGACELARSLPEVVSWMPDAVAPDGELWCHHVSGDMTSSERARRLRGLALGGAARRAVLSNARCLGEGVDVPALDGIAFVDPRSSEVDVVQAVGRAIRLSPDKKVGTVVVPVVVSATEDVEAALEDSSFKAVWDVVRALRSHDTELGEQLDALRRQLGSGSGGEHLPDKIVLDLPATVSSGFAEGITTRLVMATTSSWEESFAGLERFAREHGHARPARGTVTPGGVDLDSWVGNQRSKRRYGILSDERVRRLEALPGWTWHARDSRWEEGFARLQAYVAEHGNAWVPQKEEDGSRSQLGTWVSTQRINYAKGKLDPDRTRRLEALPGWVWFGKAARWERSFATLERYVAEHGHARVPTLYFSAEDDVKLGEWVSSQRKAKRSGELSPERVRRLEALPGWVWDILVVGDDGTRRRSTSTEPDAVPGGRSRPSTDPDQLSLAL